MRLIGTALFASTAAVFAISAAFSGLSAQTEVPAGSWTPSVAGVRDWWDAGETRIIPRSITYPNDEGLVEIFNVDGPIDPKGHPFFEPIGTNGRACVTCHQPSDAMGLSAKSAQERWEATKGSDPLFAAIDGSNCPSLPQDKRASHSLLIDHGLIRIAMPWPPRDTEGSPIKPDFSIEVVSDPSTCNLDPKYGLKSEKPMVSVFRRPRPIANLHLTARHGQTYQIKLGLPEWTNPETGRPYGSPLMADGRARTMRAQAVDALSIHMQFHGAIAPSQLARIEAFQRQLFVAQRWHRIGGDLMSGGAYASAQTIARGAEDARLGQLTRTPQRTPLPEFDGWQTESALGRATWSRVFDFDRSRLPNLNGRPGEARETPETKAFRDSVARGYESFLYRSFPISNVANFNDTLGLGNPLKTSCVECHGLRHVGVDPAPGWMDIGAGGTDRALKLRPEFQVMRQSHLPLFRVTCNAGAQQHSFFGKVIYTNDPGRALVTGRCYDVGSIIMQPFRGLAARAPFFHNGSAKNLGELVDYYDRRFSIGYTPQERQDMINFMSVL